MTIFHYSNEPPTEKKMEVETTMRASQGIPHGPKARLYYPELFQDHEEVIVYEREEFRRTFTNLRNNIRDIFWMDISLKSDKEYYQACGHYSWNVSTS